MAINVESQKIEKRKEVWYNFDVCITKKCIREVASMFVQGREYRRRDLHQQFGGQEQGGISTPLKYPLILLFTGEAGEQYGYADGWTSEGLFFYVGEGQVGDMQFIRGNAAIRNHTDLGKDLHLFSYVKKGVVWYVGQMLCTGYNYQDGPDAQGKRRQMIVFELAPLQEFVEMESASDEIASVQSQLDASSLSDLRAKALAASVEKRNPIERKQDYFYRSQAIKLYALKRSRGECEGCQQPAPFKTPNQKSYLEVHHIRRLSDGGPDDPRWVVAICPNCHRRAHYSEDASSYNQFLARRAKEAENMLTV
jgi:5-methylcytosine-specific restriction protein A